MPKADYLPRPDDAFKTWLTQFLAQMPALASQLGIGASEISSLENAATTFDSELGIWVQREAQAREQRAKKDDARVACEKLARPIVRRLKAHPAFTEGHAQLLGVVGPADDTDWTQAKPVLQLRVLPGNLVEIGFAKNGSDGVNLYSQRAGEADAAWVFLARDTQAPYIDNRPLLQPGKPEVREYKAVYVLGDAEVGQASAEYPLTVG